MASEPQDIGAQIASIQVTLRHIEAQMQEAKDHREQSSRAHTAMLERLTRLESGATYSADLPRRVAHNETENAVQDAIRSERQSTMASIRTAIFGGIAAAGTIAGTVALMVSWLTNGN